MRAAILAVAVTVIVGVMAATADEPKTHTVTIEHFRFQPDSVTVAPGDTIVWVNKDLVPHTATSKTGGFDSKVIPAENSWRFTARKKGDFAYLCTVHPAMTAMLRVR